MIMPPLPVVLFFVVLLAWPLLKLTITLFCRSRWRAQSKLRNELLSDTTRSADERRLVEYAYRQGKGDPIQLILPAVAFFAAIAIAYKYRCGVANININASEARNLLGIRPRDVERLLHDVRYKRLREDGFTLAALQYPIASAITVILIAPAALFVSLMSKIEMTRTELISRIAIGSRNAIVAFENILDGSAGRAF